MINTTNLVLLLFACFCFCVPSLHTGLLEHTFCCSLYDSTVLLPLHPLPPPPHPPRQASGPASPRPSQSPPSPRPPVVVCVCRGWFDEYDATEKAAIDGSKPQSYTTYLRRLALGPRWLTLEEQLRERHLHLDRHFSHRLDHRPPRPACKVCVRINSLNRICQNQLHTRQHPFPIQSRPPNLLTASGPHPPRAASNASGPPPPAPPWSRAAPVWCCPAPPCA